MLKRHLVIVRNKSQFDSKLNQALNDNNNTESKKFRKLRKLTKKLITGSKHYYSSYKIQIFALVSLSVIGFVCYTHEPTRTAIIAFISKGIAYVAKGIQLGKDKFFSSHEENLNSNKSIEIPTESNSRKWVTVIITISALAYSFYRVYNNNNSSISEPVIIIKPRLSFWTPENTILIGQLITLSGLLSGPISPLYSFIATPVGYTIMTMTGHYP